MQNGICPKCNSHVIIKDRRITDKVSGAIHALSLAITGRSTGWLTNNVAYGEIHAWICGECGYTELYTTNFRKLVEADRESKTSKTK
jgi:predicted nucleic-acid-binding Zn-ribbon protein